MQPGDIVRIKQSEKLIAPWRDYAEKGVRMRVRAVDPYRPRGSVDVQPADAPRKSLRHCWFDERDLVPLMNNTDMVADAIRKLRGG